MDNNVGGFEVIPAYQGSSHCTVVAGNGKAKAGKSVIDM